MPPKGWHPSDETRARLLPSAGRGRGVMAKRCQRIVGERLCGLRILAVLDGVPLCSQHLYATLARKNAA